MKVKRFYYVGVGKSSTIAHRLHAPLRDGNRTDCGRPISKQWYRWPHRYGKDLCKQCEAH